MDDRERKEAGGQGEDRALQHLQRAGLKLIARNYRCRAGEIDLVMLDGAVLALIEVRYRASGAFGGPAASVTWRKQRRIITAARHLLLTHADLRRYPARFDVVAITSGSRGLETRWIKAAFTT
jgi:putative endonuclease